MGSAEIIHSYPSVDENDINNVNENSVDSADAEEPERKIGERKIVNGIVQQLPGGNPRHRRDGS